MKRVLQGIPRKVRIVEVGPRDGLQNESRAVPLAVKLGLIRRLQMAGIDNIEAGSFVSPKWVPQMAQSDDLFRALLSEGSNSNARFSALTPNMKGLQSAISVGVQEVAVFAAASESFSRTNINCSIDESIKRFEEVARAALEQGLRVRGYVSCVLGCPYEGQVISPEKVLEVSQKLLDMGCYEISLGDTIGVGTPGSTERLLSCLTTHISSDKLAVHFHDTYGQALANITTALQFGINSVDSSISGLGGCPYAAGASGNVATEDVVYMLNGLGIETGVNLAKLVEASVYIDKFLGERRSASKYTLAKLAASFREKSDVAQDNNRPSLSTNGYTPSFQTATS